MARHLLLLFLCIAPAFTPSSAEEAYDYQHRDLDGRLHRVSDHRGQWLVINFWATWCPPCTGTPTLSRGMKLLNGSYTQSFNRRHRRVGHLFQGRFQAILVDKESYLLELSRYIVLNPVRARMVKSADKWMSSSYRATAGLACSEPLLTTDWILSCFSDRKKRAQEAYRNFVRAGKVDASPWESLKNQIFLGDDGFVEDMQCKLDPDQSLKDIPRKQKLAPPRPIGYYATTYKDRSEAMERAYLSGHYTLEEVGREFGVSYATVSRAVKRYEEACKA